MKLDLLITWMAALATLSIYSILYRENRAYRLFEHIYIGLATGYGISMIWLEALRPTWWIPMVQQGHWYWAFAMVVGLMFYTVYIPRYAWMSRLIMTTLMGLAAGTMFKGFAADYVPQIAASFLPLFQSTAPYVNLKNVVIVVTIITVMTYFFFSFEHKTRAIRGTANTGRWLLMIAFGAIFGSTVMARMALLTGRIWYLIYEWLGGTWHALAH